MDKLQVVMRQVIEQQFARRRQVYVKKSLTDHKPRAIQNSKAERRVKKSSGSES